MNQDILRDFDRVPADIVGRAAEFQAAIAMARPGDVGVLKDGETL